MTRPTDGGMATVVALMALLLMSALGTALVLNASYEVIIAANAERGQEGLYAADAAVERALGDVQNAGDWDRILDGSTRSGFVDGPGAGVRQLSDGTSLDLGQLLNMANCQKTTSCSRSELSAMTASRPWAANNPTWVLYASGPLANLLPAGAINSPYYVVVMAADDPAENDGDPLHDGNSQTNPGAGRLVLRSEAFGPRGTHKIVEVTVCRGPVPATLRILSWREIRAK